MTVEELIEKLKTMPQKDDVFFDNDGGPLTEVRTVEFGTQVRRDTTEDVPIVILG